MAAGSHSYSVRIPEWDLVYQGKSITADITGMVIEISYKDGAKTSTVPHTHRRHRMRRDMADEVEVTLEDRDHRWQGPWFPTRGDAVRLSIGYVGEKLLNCGNFQVDEVELHGPPDTVHLKCVATGITASLRTPRSAAYESYTLLQVAQTIAARHHLTVVGAPENINVSWERLSQRNETDLHFLRELAQDHGYDFSVRGTHLVFYSRTKLEQQSSVLTVSRMQVKTFEFKKQTKKIYKSASVAHHHHQSKKLISAAVTDPTTPTGDDLHIVTRVETPQQAKLKAQSALHDANMLETTGRLNTEGNVLLVAGVNITVQNFGNWDGIYHIESSRHRLERSSGYDTEIEVRKL